MSQRQFFDTNVLLYADDAADPTKKAAAEERIKRAIVDGTGVVSTQVMQEFFVGATKKLGLEVGAARDRLDAFRVMDVITVSAELVLGAVDLHKLHGLSFWDSLIVKTAASAGCELLLTEDLQDGRVIEGVKIVNPFNFLSRER